MNIICLGGRITGPMLAWDLVEAFLAAEFSQAETSPAALGQNRCTGNENKQPGGRRGLRDTGLAICVLIEN
jgi:ribose 5-phosphate isomerase RpiB